MTLCNKGNKIEIIFGCLNEYYGKKTVSTYMYIYLDQDEKENIIILAKASIVEVKKIFTHSLKK